VATVCYSKKFRL